MLIYVYVKCLTLFKKQDKCIHNLLNSALFLLISEQDQSLFINFFDDHK